MAGNSKGRRRRFGSVRQLPSGRWQARYQGPDGLLRAADETFASKTSAERWLTRTEAQIIDEDWLSPDDGSVTFDEYAAAWLEERPALRPATIRSYRSVLSRHLTPTFGGQAMSAVRDSHVRRWYNRLLDQGVGRPTAARAYIVLKAIFATAVDDGLIRRSPCRIKGASAQHSPERPLITVRQVYALADSVGPRYRSLVLMAAFCSLRWGELAGLQRRDVDLAALTVRIDRSLHQSAAGGHVFGPPKSAASRRVVIIPDLIANEIAEHLNASVGPAPIDLIFTSPADAPLHHGNFRKRVWLPAIKHAGLPGVHLHDLRHAGNVLVETGRVAPGASFGRIGERPLPAPQRTDPRRRADCNRSWNSH